MSKIMDIYKYRYINMGIHGYMVTRMYSNIPRIIGICLYEYMDIWIFMWMYVYMDKLIYG